MTLNPNFRLHKKGASKKRREREREERENQKVKNKTTNLTIIEYPGQLARIFFLFDSQRLERAYLGNGQSVILIFYYLSNFYQDYFSFNQLLFASFHNREHRAIINDKAHTDALQLIINCRLHNKRNPQ